MKELGIGEYHIATGCTYRIYRHVLTIEPKKVKPHVDRCKHCVHCKVGKLSMYNQWWENHYCEMHPKIISKQEGYFYATNPSRKACELFKAKTNN